MKIEQTVLGLIFRKSRKKDRQNDENTTDQESSSGSQQGSGNIKFRGKAIARRYSLYAIVLFSLQGFAALLGAIDLVIPDLPSPIPYEYGRAIHLGLATLWPLVGTMGMAYFFIVDALKVDLHSVKLARWQFWIVFLSSLGLYGTLSLKIGNGREFLDGLPVFYAGVSLAILMSAYNLVRTLWKHKSRITPASAIMTGGMVFLGLLLIPNVLYYSNPVADEAVKFWVVHLWEEMAFELTTSGFVSSFFITSGLAEKKDMEKWLYLEASIAVAGGMFGTGHHYYWIGFPAVWLIIGPMFSIIQMLPVVLLAHLTYKGFKKRRPMDRREKLTLWMILSSLFYHLTGASLLGLMMTVPWINLYSHGTYITSGHAHLALFGAMGFTVLAGSYNILSKGREPSKKGYLFAVIGVLLLNLGLLTMSSALLAAGFLQAYLWRYLGMDFMQVQSLVRPYLMLRAMGGATYTTGAVLVGYRIIKAWWRTREDGKTGAKVS